MAIVHFSRYVTKARRRGMGKLTPKQLEALSDQMAEAFSLDFTRGVTMLKESVTRGQMEKAVRSRNYKAVTTTKEWRKLPEHLAAAADTLGEAAASGSKLAEGVLPKLVRTHLNYDTSNPRMDDYLETRTGALVEYVTADMEKNVKIAVSFGESRKDALARLTDEAQAGIQGATRQAIESGATARDVADQVREQLRHSIGLNNRQAQALANYEGPDKEGYAERLLDQRAMMIARTEISFAMNKGQQDVWSEAQDQGLLPDTAKKVWIVDGAPCPFICEPMDGKAVKIDESFTLPDFSVVDGPPAHPHCYCVMSLDIGDNTFGGSGEDAD